MRSEPASTSKQVVRSSWLVKESPPDRWAAALERMHGFALGPLLWLLSFGPANESDPPCRGGLPAGSLAGQIRAAGRPGPHAPHALDTDRLSYGDIARGVDLLAAILADPQARAVEVLGRAGVDRLEVCARIEDGLAGYAEEGDAP